MIVKHEPLTMLWKKSWTESQESGSAIVLLGISLTLSQFQFSHL